MTAVVEAPSAPRLGLPISLVAAGAAAAIGAVWTLLDAEPRILQFAALGIIVAASIEDLRSRRIPNPFVAAALTLALFGAPSLGSASAAALLAPLPLLAFALLFAGSIGMGDVKLMAPAGALVALGELQQLLVLMALLGGLMGVAVLVRSGRRGTLPYGPAIAAAAVIISLL